MSKYNNPNYRRDWRRARKVSFVEKLGGVCSHCGTTERLEFDHIDRNTKLFDIATHLDSSTQTLLSELKKCQLLCKSCHATKSQAERGNDTSHRHGLLSTYVNLGCRCSDCKNANRVYMNNYRKALYS